MITIDEQIFTYRKQLKSKLDPMRYEHCLSVSYTCMALDMISTRQNWQDCSMTVPSVMVTMN